MGSSLKTPIFEDKGRLKVGLSLKRPVFKDEFCDMINTSPQPGCFDEYSRIQGTKIIAVHQTD